MDTEDDRLKRTLERFPSNFTILAYVEKNPKSNLQTIKNKLEHECEEEPYDTEMETLRAWNLMSFLCFVLGEVDLAVKYNTQVLEKCPKSIIGVCNKAWIYFKQRKQFDVVQSQIKLLDNLEKMSENVLMAEAEIAFSLSRFGMPLYEQAQLHFRDVLEKCNKIKLIEKGKEKSFVDIYPEEVCIWQFGLALTQKRMLNIHNIHDAKQVDISQQKQADVAGLFASIINMKSDKRSVKRYKARAYVEIGFLAYRSKKLRWKPKECFKKAYRMFRGDVFVLERSGKYFRYANKIDKSVWFLEKALKVRETSFAHHHLALSLKRKLEIRGYSTDAKPEDIHKVTKSLFSSQEERDASTTSVLEPPSTECLRTDNRDDCQVSGVFSYNSTMAPQLSKLNPEAPEFIPNSGKGLVETLNNHFQTVLSLDSAIGSSRSETPDMASSYEVNSQEGKRINMRDRSLIAMIKSPKNPKFIDRNEENDTVEKIHYHLDKSIELFGNCAALYDKGILYRQTDQPLDALTIFEKLLENKDKRCSLVQLSNAYEQAGLCMFFILTDENPKADEKLPPNISEYNMKENFKRSIEISCLLVSKIPMLKHCWASAPTLQSFLRGTAKTTMTVEQEKERLKDLSFLYTKLGKYSDAIEVLQKLNNLAEDDAEKVEVTSDIVRAYVKKRNFDDAVLALDLIMCLPDGISKIDESLYINVQLEGGMDAMRNGHTEVARLRFGNMFDFGRDAGDNPETQESNDSDIDIGSDRFDVFILCDEDNEGSGKELGSVLERFGIKITINTHNVLFGSLQSAGYENAVKCSKHVIVVYDIKPENTKSVNKFRYWFDLVRGVLTERCWGNIVIVTPSSEIKLPAYLAVYKTVIFDLSVVVVDEKLPSNDFVCEKVKEILTKISAKISTSV